MSVNHSAFQFLALAYQEALGLEEDFKNQKEIKEFNDFQHLLNEVLLKRRSEEQLDFSAHSSVSPSLALQALLTLTPQDLSNPTFPWEELLKKEKGFVENYLVLPGLKKFCAKDLRGQLADVQLDQSRHEYPEYSDFDQIFLYQKEIFDILNHNGLLKATSPISSSVKRKISSVVGVSVSHCAPASLDLLNQAEALGDFSNQEIAEAIVLCYPNRFKWYNLFRKRSSFYPEFNEIFQKAFSMLDWRKVNWDTVVEKKTLGQQWYELICHHLNFSALHPDKTGKTVVAIPEDLADFLQHIAQAQVSDDFKFNTTVVRLACWKLIMGASAPEKKNLLLTQFFNEPHLIQEFLPFPWNDKDFALSEELQHKAIESLTSAVSLVCLKAVKLQSEFKKTFPAKLIQESNEKKTSIDDVLTILKTINDKLQTSQSDVLKDFVATMYQDLKQIKTKQFSPNEQENMYLKWQLSSNTSSKPVSPKKKM